MPNCSNCEKPQGRLNKGALCKSCFHNKINGDINKDTLELDGDLELLDNAVLKELNVIDLIKVNMAQEKRYNSEIICLMKEQIEVLQNEIIHKNTLIENLMIELQTSKYNDNNMSTISKSESSSNHNSTLSAPYAQHKSSTNHVNDNIKELQSVNYSNELLNREHIANEWNIVNSNNNANLSIDNHNKRSKPDIPLFNRFNSLAVGDEVLDTLNERVYNDDANIQTNSHARKQTNIGILAGTSDGYKISRRPQTTVPGNSTYADITRRGKKVCIIGASIVQRINMREFNNNLHEMYATKASYPGANVERARYYMKKPLEEENPDTVIINIGTNNFTKKRNQSEEDIANEIVNMVEECRIMGVNDIFVSGLTIRKGFYEKVCMVNNILMQKARIHNFTFIDNSNICSDHLNHDGLHLKYEGTCILTKKFLDHLNEFYSSFSFNTC